MTALASAPALAALPVDPTAPVRLVVGFHAYPQDLDVGDSYLGARVVHVDETLRFAAVVTGEESALRARVVLDDNVRYLEPDPEMVLVQFTPNDARYPSMYGPQQIGAPAAWDRTLGSTAVIVCITDTGVRNTHEDLAGRFAGGYNFIGNNNNVADDHGHGTHVTGTAAATTNNGVGIAGIAQATYTHAKVLNSAGSGTWSQVSSGIRWCADNGAHVQSASLGGSGGAAELLDAVNYAWNAGVVNVASAGNSGPCSSCVGYPGAYDNEIAVACTTSTKALCSFSSQGPQVDLAAPGNLIDSTCYNTDSTYCSKSGTSMSAPHVAGAAALLKADNPALTNAQIRSQLEGTAEDLGAAGTDNSFGKGLVRPDLAMGGAPPPPPPPPPPANSMHVQAMAGSFTHNGSRHNIVCKVTIEDNNHAALSGASVSVTFTKPNGNTASRSGTTDASGVASLTLNNQKAHGNYTCAVTNVTKSGYTYDSASNVVTSITIGVT